ncbi:putative DNA-binding transcriptional regulator YafY [Tamilnaduibacter salinus]|uniref:Putative DNA-binding transcriptional regulator YafY n=1 Tax=Tamilnaduibacter salinus TaxID=1484056 RepID=A0A2U1D172_9GAMM|nr:YafY family protein [Tamilnaduibacter salinus]PVY79145.1 putative DNA-binding transcriptional regulator YafY [Tamilnaduibacter salinus]
MSRINRIYRIHDIFRNASRPVPMRTFMDDLEVSRNTITRDFEYLRDTLGAPIEYCRDWNGHQYAPDAPVFELPGFWMNPSELHALLACEQLLESVQPGLMTYHLAPLRQRIRKVLGEAGHDAEQVSERVRIQPVQRRDTDDRIFDPVAEATLRSDRLVIDYNSRSGNGAREREISPQRLLHYRSNWYLLAFCHQSDALRLFSLDRIRKVQATDGTAEPVSPEELDAFTSGGFGIFGGTPTATAHIRFTPHAARWVAEEQWHPDQTSEWREGWYHLWVPYSQPTELVMDVLKFGADAEVIGPMDLREMVAGKVRALAKIY